MQVKIGETLFEDLGTTLNNNAAILNVPTTLSFDDMEALVKENHGVFTLIDNLEENEQTYDVYDRLVSMQKVLEPSIDGVDELYTLFLYPSKDPSDIITGEEVTIEEAIEMRKTIEKMSQYLPEDADDSYAWVFPVWKTDTAYVIGDRVSYKGLLYKCVQAHTSQDDWTPDVAVSLWARTSDPTVEFPDWIQPTGAQDAYSIGDKVSHNDKHWISTADANVWEPGVYGWDEVQ